MTVALYSPNSNALRPEHVTVRFQGINFSLVDLEDAEFNSLFDRVVDDAAELEERAEGWTAAEFVEKKANFQRQQAQSYYNLELLELESKRRNRLMANQSRAEVY